MNLQLFPFGSVPSGTALQSSADLDVVALTAGYFKGENQVSTSD